MSTFSQEFLENRAFCSRAIAFNTQLPIGGSAGTKIGDTGEPIPEAVRMLPDGSADVQLYAPSAQTVALRMPDQVIPLEKGTDGYWHCHVCPDTPGLKTVFFQVDGVDVLHPLAPVGFGYSQPMNYIDFPEAGCDFYLIKDVPHGTVAQEVYFSQVTGQYESCMIYLPPEYMGKSQESYPVLYLQHGHGENEKCWLYQGKVNFIMDNLLADGKAVPCIIVMNNGMVHTKGPDGGPQMDSGLLERLLIEDCIPFIEEKYRVKSGRAYRAMAGLSMGSMQTSMITMNHPELFTYVGIFSGFLRSLRGTNTNDSHLQALRDPDTFKAQYKVFLRAMGTEDGFRSAFEADSGILEAAGLSPEQWPAHQIRWYPGNHEWQVWRKCIWDFLPLIFR